MRTAYLISRWYLETNEVIYDIYSEPCPTMLEEKVIQTIIDKAQSPNFATAKSTLIDKYPQYPIPQYSF